jgi:hypothetical protein
MSNTSTPGAGFQPASLPNTADELLGRLLLMQPGEVRPFETRHGPSEATLTDVVDVGPDGTPTELGERAIFWQLVRRQLAKATGEQPWIGGRLVQDGQAYRLEAPTEAEAALLGKALGQLAAV